MDKALSIFNNLSTTAKNLIWLIGLIVGASFAYFTIETKIEKNKVDIETALDLIAAHSGDEDIHMSQERVFNIIEAMQKLRDRIEVLEWDLKQLKELTARRHYNHKDDIEIYHNEIVKLEQNIIEMRQILFEAFIKEVTQSKMND